LQVFHPELVVQQLEVGLGVDLEVVEEDRRPYHLEVVDHLVVREVQEELVGQVEPWQPYYFWEELLALEVPEPLEVQQVPSQEVLVVLAEPVELVALVAPQQEVEVPTPKEVVVVEAQLYLLFYQIWEVVAVLWPQEAKEAEVLLQQDQVGVEEEHP
jgi:hypothetical protein